MQQTEVTRQAEVSAARTRRLPRRWITLAAVLVSLLLLLVLPPLISVNRYQHRIATSISTSLGRPVHFDSVSLNLLPVPSFTITNFVVEEDPAFGAEPIIRANRVKATVRVSSLWLRRVEISRISFTEPSLNLVRNRKGAWNFQGIILQAAQIESAPTGQRTAGRAPRFPYIEATGARINLKQGYEKTPFSLAESDFALWLPDPGAWRMRIQGRPLRTDTSVSDTGILQIEATLGRATSLEAVPLDMQAAWRSAPLGEASRLVLGRDLGMRGDLTVTASIQGNLSKNSLHTRMEVSGLRRSEFVPEQALSLDLDCKGVATREFRSISDLRCSWPVADGNGATLALAGSIPDVLAPATADLQAGTARLPAAVLLNWLRVMSSRVPPTLVATGLLSGSVAHAEGGPGGWVGQASVPELRLSGAKFGPVPLAVEDLLVQSTDREGDAGQDRATGQPLAVSEVLLPLGGKDPATLEAAADGSGYTLHLSGMIALSRLAALAGSVPQFGDGLVAVLPTNRAAGPVRLELRARREWGGEQVWTDLLAHPGATPSRPARTKGHRRRR